MMCRLDTLLVTRGLVRSRNQAANLIRTGKVRVEGVVERKPGASVPSEARLAVEHEEWVSRAAYKLLGALEDLEITVPSRALDAGASTGGFTQVLLSRGAEKVYAVDVGTDQLAPELRGDPRVSVHEQTNLRDLTLDHVEGAPVDLVVADVSFISLSLLLEPLFGVVKNTGTVLLMVKPQFEVGRERLGKGGVVRNPLIRKHAVDSVIAAAQVQGWSCVGRSESRLAGPSGNLEYFIHLRPAHLC